jgi:AcrR family transcriptional regulator
MVAIDIADLTAEPSVAEPSVAERRVVDATLRCIARFGVGKTTLDDVAAEAGCSRATVYRLFPGGKDRLLDAVVLHETARFAAGLTDALAGTGDIEDLLVSGVGFAARHLAEHEALQFLLAYEPELILPMIAFRQMDLLLAAASDLAAPHIAPHVGEGQAARAGEWLARIVVSYLVAPSAGFDLTDPESIRRLVRAHVLPGLTPFLRGEQLRVDN